MQHLKCTQNVIEITGRTDPPDFQESANQPYAVFFAILIVVTLFVMPAIMVHTGNENLTVPGSIFGFVIVSFGGVTFFMYKANLVRFRAIRQDETLNFYDKLGKQEVTYYFRDVKNYRVMFGTETITTRDRYGNVLNVRQQQLYILDMVTTVDTARIIHVGNPDDVWNMGKALSQFTDKPLIDAGQRVLS